MNKPFFDWGKGFRVPFAWALPDLGLHTSQSKAGGTGLGVIGVLGCFGRNWMALVDLVVNHTLPGPSIFPQGHLLGVPGVPVRFGFLVLGKL